MKKIIIYLSLTAFIFTGCSDKKVTVKFSQKMQNKVPLSEVKINEVDNEKQGLGYYVTLSELKSKQIAKKNQKIENKKQMSDSEYQVLAKGKQDLQKGVVIVKDAKDNSPKMLKLGGETATYTVKVHDKGEPRNFAELIKKELDAKKLDYSKIEDVVYDLPKRQELIDCYLKGLNFYADNLRYCSGYKGSLYNKRDYSIYKEKGYDTENFEYMFLLGTDEKLTTYEELLADIKSHFSKEKTEQIIKENVMFINSVEETKKMKNFMSDSAIYYVYDNHLFANVTDGGCEKLDIELTDQIIFKYKKIDVVSKNRLSGVMIIPVVFTPMEVGYEPYNIYMREVELDFVKEDGVWKLDTYPLEVFE